MPNIRNAILEAIVSEFATIQVANGYQNDIGLVTRELKSLEQVAISQFPAIMVVDDGSEVPLDVTGDEKIHTLQPSIVGYYRATENLSVGFNSFLADVMKVVYKPINLAGNGDGISILSIDPVITFPPHVTFVMTLDLKYWFNKNNP